MPEIGLGEAAVLDAGDERVLAYRCDWQDGSVLAVFNLADTEVEARLDPHDADRLEDITDLLGDGSEYSPCRRPAGRSGSAPTGTGGCAAAAPGPTCRCSRLLECDVRVRHAGESHVAVTLRAVPARLG